MLTTMTKVKTMVKMVKMATARRRRGSITRRITTTNNDYNKFKFDSSINIMNYNNNLYKYKNNVK